MNVKARIAILPPGKNQLQIKSLDLPAPGPWEVMIEQRATGVCHSQLDVIANTARLQPLVIGHESTGAVIAAGSEVTHVQVGDDVLVTWLPRSAVRSRPAVPPKVALGDGNWAVTHNVFTWGTHTVVDEQHVVPAPEATPDDLGAIIGCAVMTGAGAVINRAHVRAGESVAIWGVGGVGLAAVAAAHAVGASPVIAVDIDDAKLELARRHGADQLVNGSSGDPVAAVHAITQRGDRDGVDYAMECTGRAECAQQCIAALRGGVAGLEPGGTALVVGAPQRPLELDGMDILIGEKSLIGNYGGGCLPERDFPTFVEWQRSGQVDFASLVTDRYPLDRVNEAVADLRAGRILGRAVLEL